MAARLDDLAYRKNEPVLNPDPARYGFDHSPEKFRRDLIELMELITQASPSRKVRFAFVGLKDLVPNGFYYGGHRCERHSQADCR